MTKRCGGEAQGKEMNTRANNYRRHHHHHHHHHHTLVKQARSHGDDSGGLASNADVAQLPSSRTEAALEAQ